MKYLKVLDNIEHFRFASVRIYVARLYTFALARAIKSFALLKNCSGPSLRPVKGLNVGPINVIIEMAVIKKSSKKTQILFRLSR